MNDLFLRELDRTALSKTVLKILEKCDPLVDHYNRSGLGVQRIKLYRKDFTKLRDALKESNQDIAQCCYRGYKLEGE